MSDKGMSVVFFATVPLMLMLMTITLMFGFGLIGDRGPPDPQLSASITGATPGPYWLGLSGGGQAYQLTGEPTVQIQAVVVTVDGVSHGATGWSVDPQAGTWSFNSTLPLGACDPSTNAAVAYVSVTASYNGAELFVSSGPEPLPQGSCS